MDNPHSSSQESPRIVQISDDRDGLLSALKEGFHDKTFADGVLLVEHQIFYIHKFFICSQSRYLKNSFSEGNSTKVVKVESIESKTMLDLLKYMYTGYIEIREEKLDTFLKAAKLLEIESLLIGKSPDSSNIERESTKPILNASKCGEDADTSSSPSFSDGKWTSDLVKGLNELVHIMKSKYEEKPESLEENNNTVLCKEEPQTDNDDSVLTLKAKLFKNGIIVRGDGLKSMLDIPASVLSNKDISITQVQRKIVDSIDDSNKSSKVLPTNNDDDELIYMGMSPPQTTSVKRNLAPLFETPVGQDMKVSKKPENQMRSPNNASPGINVGSAGSSILCDKQPPLKHRNYQSSPIIGSRKPSVGSGTCMYTSASQKSPVNINAPVKHSGRGTRRGRPPLMGYFRDMPSQQEKHVQSQKYMYSVASGANIPSTSPIQSQVKPYVAPEEQQHALNSSPVHSSVVSEPNSTFTSSIQSQVKPHIAQNSIKPVTSKMPTDSVGIYGKDSDLIQQENEESSLIISSVSTLSHPQSQTSFGATNTDSSGIFSYERKTVIGGPTKVHIPTCSSDAVPFDNQVNNCAPVSTNNLVACTSTYVQGDAPLKGFHTVNHDRKTSAHSFSPGPQLTTGTEVAAVHNQAEHVIDPFQVFTSDEHLVASTPKTTSGQSSLKSYDIFIEDTPLKHIDSSLIIEVPSDFYEAKDMGDNDFCENPPVPYDSVEKNIESHPEKATSPMDAFSSEESLPILGEESLPIPGALVTSKEFEGFQEQTPIVSLRKLDKATISDNQADKVKRKKQRTPKICSVCKTKCENQDALVLHMRKHNGEKVHQCNSCDFCSKSLPSLKVHITRKHKRKLHDSEKAGEVTPLVFPKEPSRKISKTDNKIEDESLNDSDSTLNYSPEERKAVE